MLDRVGIKMFSNCYSLSTKYINRLIKDVTEIKDNAFYADKGNRGKFSDEADNKMAIEIPSKVTKIGIFKEMVTAWRLVLKHSENVMNWQR